MVHFCQNIVKNVQILRPSAADYGGREEGVYGTMTVLVVYIIGDDRFRQRDF